MLTVELIYDIDCPNVKDARVQLLQAFTNAKLPPDWKEWNRGDPESPSYVRFYGSPTILVNSQDVAGTSPSAVANCCRLYLDKSGRLRGVPSVEEITSALLKQNSVKTMTRINIKRQSSWRSILATVPGISIALLPRLTCPACWPAYAGLLSYMGLGFMNYTPYLFPLTVLFLTLAVVSLGYRAKSRRGYKPLVLGMFALITVIVGKFVFGSDLAMYGGITLLMGASLWNAWPKRAMDSSSCPECASERPLSG